MLAWKKKKLQVQLTCREQRDQTELAVFGMFALLFLFNPRANLITMNTKQKYPNSLRRYRLQAGLRQVDVARQIGLDFADRLSRWENGLAMPNVANLFRLASIYKVSPQDLYQDLRHNIDTDSEPPKDSDL